MRQSHEAYLKRAIEVSKNAVAHGNLPFGCILVDADGNIVMEQENENLTTGKCTAHAETMLAERASVAYAPDYLWGCTLYTSAEPCCMCAGAIYWANIGAVGYAMAEADLLEMTGGDEVNPTFSLPCREVFARGQKPVQVAGPFPALAEEAAAAHRGVWDKDRTGG